MDPPGGRLPTWARVLPHYFKPLGYRTYHSGKWHLMALPAGARRRLRPLLLLEDHNRYFAPSRPLLDDRPLPPVPDGTGFYLTTAIADYAMGFLQEHAEQHAGRAVPAVSGLHLAALPLAGPAGRHRSLPATYREGWDVIRQRRYGRMLKLGIVDCQLSPRDPHTIPFWNLAEAELRQRIGPGEVGHAVPWSDLIPQQQEFQALKMAIHAAMIDRMDRQIGRVLDAA